MMNARNILLSHHRQAVMDSDWRKATFLFRLLKDKKTVIDGFELQEVSFYMWFGERFGLHNRQVEGQFRFEFYYY